MSSGKDKKAIIALLLVAFILLLAVGFLAYRILFENRGGGGEMPRSVKVEEVKGERFEYDDFYHAKDGTWRVETDVHLLKERKYVSSESELKLYLVYEAKAGEIVRMKESAGRWKLLEVVKDDQVVAIGWADVDADRATRL